MLHLQLLSLPERKKTQNKKAVKKPYRYDFSSEMILLFFWAAAGRRCCSFQTHNLNASGKVKVMGSGKGFFQTLILNMTNISDCIVEALCKNGNPI